jgi:glycosyltransferase involved in cell wall biosynthesis
MSSNHVRPDNTTFVLLCFEGPDRYALAGGLGVRVTELSSALADAGYETHLVFVGDPSRPGREEVSPHLTLHRWGQWISAHHPKGVYEGEYAKIADYSGSVPAFILDDLLGPRLAEGGLSVVLSEEWHTAGATIGLAERAADRGVAGRVLQLWNANNTYSFDSVDWRRLERSATLTAVSRYMKQILRERGLETHVIPNGIPRRLLSPVESGPIWALARLFERNLLLAKVARWDPDKGWLAAVEAVADLKAREQAPRFIVRGGIEPHGDEVIAHARRLGLSVATVPDGGETVQGCLEAIARVREADVIDLRFFVPEAFLRVLFATADGVLANSNHEPFGLVGLEVMAAGGIAYTGSTGEDYAHPFDNAVVLDTGDPREIVGQALFLREHAPFAEELRRNAHRTALRYTWDGVLTILFQKLDYLTHARSRSPQLILSDA